MTTSVRYKFVNNTSGAVLSTTNFPVNNDGDDRQVKFVKRVLSAIDIGTGAGKVGNAGGAIVDIISNNYNVLWVEGLTYRPIAAVSGAKPYVLIDNDFIVDEYAKISYTLGINNTIIVTDLAQGTNAALAIGDIVTLKVTLGSVSDKNDSMN